MSERAEVVVGVVVLLVVVALGLGAHFRGELSAVWSGSTTPAVVEAAADVVPPRDAFRDGVPAFGPPATDAELALVAPLRTGGLLDDWVVEGIDAVTDGALVIHLLHDGSRMNLDVTLTAGATALPPAAAGPYGIYVTHAVGDRARGTVGLSLAESLARILSANLAVPAPPGLRPYAPVYEPTGEPGLADALGGVPPAPAPSEGDAPTPPEEDAPTGLVPDRLTEVPGE